MAAEDELAHVKGLLEQYRSNLRLLERQVATYGSVLNVPVKLANDVQQTKEEIERLQARLRELSMGGETSGEPYPGLLPFTSAQAHYYYGRALERERLGAVVRSAERPMSVVVGPSGYGKSSLVLAGLLPTLGEHWHILLLTPGAYPLRTLAEKVATLETGGLNAKAELAISLERHMAAGDEGLSRYLSTILQSRADIGTLLIVVDQLEEVITLPAGQPAERQRLQRQFIANLKMAAEQLRQRVRVVATLSARYSEPLLKLPDIPREPQLEIITVGPMSETELRDAIEKPAADAGARFEQGLVNRLLADMRDQPAALPLLQFTLAQLWEEREGDLMTHAAYDALGGVSGAVNKRASEAYSRLSADQQHLARNLFVRLVAVTEDVTYTRRRARRVELNLPDVPTEIVDRLIDQLSQGTVRLIAVEADSVMLAHEALIYTWGELHQWLAALRKRLAQHGQTLLALQHLSVDAADWEAHDGDPSYLYRGTQLREAQEVVRSLLATNDTPADGAAAREDPADQSPVTMVLNITEREFLRQSERVWTRAQRWRSALEVGSALALMLLVASTGWAMAAERWPFEPQPVWTSTPFFAGKSVTTLDWGADDYVFAGFQEIATGRSGVARSADGGVKWEMLPLKGQTFPIIRIDGSNPRTVYVSISNDGLYESTDSGSSWESIGDTLPMRFVQALVVAPDKTIYVGNYKLPLGIYMRKEEDTTWIPMIGAPNSRVNFLDWFHNCPGGGECLLVGADDGLWRWTRKDSWQHLLKKGPILAALVLNETIVAAGTGAYALSSGVEPLQISGEFIRGLTIMQDTELWVAGAGGRGHILKWVPGQIGMTVVDDAKLDGALTVAVVKTPPNDKAEIWVGSRAGLHHRVIKHWYQFFQ